MDRYKCKPRLLELLTLPTQITVPVPSIEAAKKIASALGVTLDYLAGEASSAAFDRRTVERIQDIEQLDEGEKQHVFALLDAFLAKNKMQAILK